jgi:hypothetical protein
MKNKMIKLAVIAAASVALAQTVQAQTPITGSINFEGGDLTYNSTAITSITTGEIVSGLDVPSQLPTGSFAGTAGTVGTPTSVTFAAAGFTFSPLSNLTNPLWTFNFDGLTYSFNLLAVTSYDATGGLLVDGNGTLTITEIGGASAGFSPTSATFSISANDNGGPLDFGFTAGNNANVPDGGTTAMLLGAGLSGLALLKRKLVA